MGYGSILSIIHTASIDKMLNKNGVNNGYELNSFRCKQGLNRISYVDSCYRPQTTLRKGNVFTSVCQEFCPWGGVVSQHALGGGMYIPVYTGCGCGKTPRQTPHRQTTLWADTSPGIHPPGQTPHPRRPLQRTVRILLECVLVFFAESKAHCRGIWN